MSSIAVARQVRFVLVRIFCFFLYKTILPSILAFFSVEGFAIVQFPYFLFMSHQQIHSLTVANREAVKELIAFLPSDVTSVAASGRVQSVSADA